MSTPSVTPRRATGSALWGESLPSGLFKISEAADLEPGPIADVLNGMSLGCVFRGALASTECKRIFERFWSSPGLWKREDADAWVIGAYHFGMTLGEYLSRTRASRGDVEALLTGTDDVVERVVGPLREMLAADGTKLRAARHDGETANRFVARSWSFPGEYSLDPHEDEAQCLAPAQAGFEVQRFGPNPIVAANMCIRNGDAGALHIWNIRPSPEARRACGAEERGYPYALADLEPFDHRELRVRDGDIYFFNGTFIHAVGAVSGADRRTTLSFFLSRIADDTVVQWT